MKFEYTTENEKNSMRLQGVGVVKGQEARNIKSGDVLMWNFGSKENVDGIIKETEKTILISISTESGYTGKRRLKKDRLVLILKK